MNEVLTSRVCVLLFFAQENEYQIVEFVTNKVKGLFGQAPPPKLPKIRSENTGFVDGKCLHNIFTYGLVLYNVYCIFTSPTGDHVVENCYDKTQHVSIQHVYTVCIHRGFAQPVYVHFMHIYILCVGWGLQGIHGEY